MQLPLEFALLCSVFRVAQSHRGFLCILILGPILQTLLGLPWARFAGRFITLFCGHYSTDGAIPGPYSIYIKTLYLKRIPSLNPTYQWRIDVGRPKFASSGALSSAAGNPSYTATLTSGHLDIYSLHIFFYLWGAKG